MITTSSQNPDEAIAKAKAAPGLEGRDLVRNVSCASAYDWNQGMWDWEKDIASRQTSHGKKKCHG